VVEQLLATQEGLGSMELVFVSSGIEQKQRTSGILAVHTDKTMQSFFISLQETKRLGKYYSSIGTSWDKLLHYL
jgi:hypothetical protein